MTTDSPNGGPTTILRRLRAYMELHKRATLGDLALHFDVPADAMGGMLETWERKGRIRILDAAATCNTSCPTACDDTAMTIYEWVANPVGRAGTFTALPMLDPAATAPSGTTCRQHPIPGA